MYLRSTSCGEIGLILHHILFKILGYKINGTFVEVGSNDGKTGSFTYNLAKIGWNGLNCEPIPRLFDICKKNHENHPNVKNIQIAIGDKKDVLAIIDADTLSTMDKDTLELYLKTDWTKNYFKDVKKCKVNVDTLDSILNINGFNNKIIDLLVLDVEGYEENVLNGFSINNFKPIIIIIEIPDQHENFINNTKLMEKFKRIREYFKINNYSLLVNDIVDNVYVRNENFNIKDKEIFSKFIKFPQY